MKCHHSRIMTKQSSCTSERQGKANSGMYAYCVQHIDHTIDKVDPVNYSKKYTSSNK